MCQKTAQSDIKNTLEIDETYKSALADINSIHIDDSLPASLRKRQYIEQIKNPYCFLCGSTPVLLRFSPDGKELSAKIKRYFIYLKRG